LQPAACHVQENAAAACGSRSHHLWGPVQVPVTARVLANSHPKFAAMPRRSMQLLGCLVLDQPGWALPARLCVVSWRMCAGRAGPGPN
jgi:hypothetical protein